MAITMNDWGPVQGTANAGGISPKDFSSKEITLSMDSSTASATLYSDLIEMPLTESTQFIWNTETETGNADCVFQIFIQLTDDAELARAGAESDTDWVSTRIKRYNASSEANVREVHPLNVDTVYGAAYVRFKFTLGGAAWASLGNNTIRCMLVNKAPLSQVRYTSAIGDTRAT